MEILIGNQIPTKNFTFSHSNDPSDGKSEFNDFCFLKKVKLNYTVFSFMKNRTQKTSFTLSDPNHSHHRGTLSFLSPVVMALITF